MTINDERLKAFLGRLRRMSTFTSTIQHGTKSPSQSSQAIKRKGIHTGKEEVKFSVGGLNLYVENPNDPPKNMLEVINDSAKLQDLKSAFIHKEQFEKEIEKH